MRLLVDMNLSPAWVPALESAGFGAVHWSAVGDASASDAPSVFQTRTEDVSPDALAGRAVALLLRFESELNAGARVVVDEMRERIRVLPLRQD